MEHASADLAGRRDPRIQGVLVAIETRFAEPDLSLAKLAREQNLSVWRLSHLLLLHGGTGFREGLHDVRCAQALRLLHETPLLVKQVAASVGYGGSRQLSRQLRRRYRLTASLVRDAQPDPGSKK